MEKPVVATANVSGISAAVLKFSELFGAFFNQKKKKQISKLLIS